MRRLRHLGGLLKEFGMFAWRDRAWWLIPMIVIMLLLMLLVVATEVGAPFLYPVF